MDLYADDTTVELIYDLLDTTLAHDVNSWTVKDGGPVHYWVKPYPVLGTGRHGHPCICIALHASKAGEPETPTPADAVRAQAFWVPLAVLRDPSLAHFYGEQPPAPVGVAMAVVGDLSHTRHTVIRPKHLPSWRATDITETGRVPFGEYFLKGDPIYGFIDIQQVGERRFGLAFDWTTERIRSRPFSEIVESLLPGVLNKAYPPRTVVLTQANVTKAILTDATAPAATKEIGAAADGTTGTTRRRDNGLASFSTLDELTVEVSKGITDHKNVSLTAGNVADLAGITRSALYDRLTAFGLTWPEFRARLRAIHPHLRRRR